MKKLITGTIVRISGPVIDVRFREGEEPPIHSLLTVAGSGRHMEVSAHLGNGVVRAVALEAPEGLHCGMDAVGDGSGITVPVGDEVIGRVVDVLGRPVDGRAISPPRPTGPSTVPPPHLPSSALRRSCWKRG